ncbi:hypothetical protein OG413_41365 [Streptomyces sp. NBC_01433]|uniref:hypothetical protein n=1 Tax=Streptomyces sp. NBC_01433 TaxID=2903864 RepID=UPI0022505667|nr:hypothetical protein [Streptomyces sp. NBC_01433]MCX4681653.1 hypothetical protein [Streptomyces sp. NBC_01433]
MRAVVDDGELWNTERQDYEQQDPADRSGHLFEHLLRIDRFLLQLSPPDHVHDASDNPVTNHPVSPPPQPCAAVEPLADGTTITVAGLDYERVTDPRALSPGQWLRFTKPLGDTDTMTLHLTVIEPVGRHADGTGVLCRRHGRALMPTEQHIVLTKPVIELGQVYRATTQPPRGIPGTWCDSYDGNGDHCGLSLHHHKNCRH